MPVRSKTRRGELAPIDQAPSAPEHISGGNKARLFSPFFRSRDSQFSERRSNTGIVDFNGPSVFFGKSLNLGETFRADGFLTGPDSLQLIFERRAELMRFEAFANPAYQSIHRRE